MRFRRSSARPPAVRRSGRKLACYALAVTIRAGTDAAGEPRWPPWAALAAVSGCARGHGPAPGGGSGHALTPGHGKALAARDVLPEQLTPWLELLSGAIVVVLGAVLPVARTRRLLATGEVHHHHHGHSHRPGHSHGHGHGHGGHHHHALEPPREGGAPVTRRALMGLGVSGGLVPCPAALVLGGWLTAESVHHLWPR